MGTAFHSAAEACRSRRRSQRPRRARCNPSQSAATLSRKRRGCARPRAAAPITAKSDPAAAPIRPPPPHNVRLGCPSTRHRSAVDTAPTLRRAQRMPPQPPRLRRRSLRGCAAAAHTASTPPSTARTRPRNLRHSHARRFPPAAAARVASISDSAGADEWGGREQCGLAGRGSVGQRECKASGNEGSEPGVAKSVRAPGRRRDRWHHGVQIELRRPPAREDAAARTEEIRRGHGR
jgi:hypothetical protein